MIARPLAAVLEREVIKLVRQRGRLLAAMVRPLLWLLVIGSGIAAMQGAGADYRSFLVPGVLGMTLLFGGMLAALSTVYDRESGVMRMLLTAPVAHHWIVIAKALGATLSATIQGLMLLALLALLGFLSPPASVLLLAAGMLGTALACASLGMLAAAWSRGLENFAAMMNFVIFPVFFLSGSLYPVQQLPPVLRIAASVNPYAYGVDLIRHSGVAGASVHGPDFGVGTDCAVLAVFIVGALAVASARFASLEGRDLAAGSPARALTSGRREPRTPPGRG